MQAPPAGSYNMYEISPSQDAPSPRPVRGIAESSTVSAGSGAVAVSTEVVANRALVPAQELSQPLSQTALETAPRNPLVCHVIGQDAANRLSDTMPMAPAACSSSLIVISAGKNPIR